MKMKKTLTTGLAISLFAALGSPVFADENNIVNESTVAASYDQTIDLQDGFKNLSSDTVISEVLTFDELVSVMAKKEGITEDKASSIIISNSDTSNRSTENRLNAAKSATYRTLTKYLQGVDSDYTPSLQFYCETTEGGSFRGIVKILNTSLNPIDGNIAKVFNGTIYVNLENPNKIHYIANGKFYHDGKITSVTGNIGITVGGFLNLGISATGNNNLYFTIFQPGDVLF